MNAHRYYVAARRVLLDALEDLAEHRDAIVVVGAQAVYLRCGATNVGVAEYTIDGDLAVDSDRLTDIPLLEDVMGARFGHAVGPTGSRGARRLDTVRTRSRIVSSSRRDRTG